MSRDLEIEWQRVKRNIALMFSLARMADRAACRSCPIRCLMLWIFRRVEPVALNYVIDVSPPLHRNSRQAILYLAALFRAAARQMDRELRWERRRVRRLAKAAPDLEDTPPITRISTFPPGRRKQAAFQTDLCYPSTPRLDSS